MLRNNVGYANFRRYPIIRRVTYARALESPLTHCRLNELPTLYIGGF